MFSTHLCNIVIFGVVTCDVQISIQNVTLPLLYMQEEFQLALFKNRKKEILFVNRVLNPFAFVYFLDGDCTIKR